MSSFWTGIIGSTAAGMMALLGGLPVFFFRKLSFTLYSVFLAFSAGVMVAASFFSLIIPALDNGNVFIVLAGVLLGAVFVHFADLKIPHEHFIVGKEGPTTSRIRGITLLFLAMTIHNFPEGMAVGVSFTESFKTGLSVAIGIGIQNIPEGMAVALPARGLGYSPRKAFLLTFLSSVVEPIGEIIGATLILLARPFLPFLMSFAAGAMLFVVSDEMIPESHGGGRERKATFAFIAGLINMLALDVLLG